jgi:ABC-type Fe2+-enterobactin transport system substrate-binding protein
MNYSDELKQKETKLLNLKAQAMAKKQSILDMLEKKKKAEAEVQNQLGISLAEVPETLKNCKAQLDLLCSDLNKEVEDIELEFAKIKC